MWETADLAMCGEALSMMCLHSGASRKLETSIINGWRLRVISSSCRSSPPSTMPIFLLKPTSTPGHRKLPPSKTSSKPESSSAALARLGARASSSTLKKAYRPAHLPFASSAFFSRPWRPGFATGLCWASASSRSSGALGRSAAKSAQSALLPPQQALTETWPVAEQAASSSLEQEEAESPMQRTWYPLAALTGEVHASVPTPPQLLGKAAAVSSAAATDASASLAQAACRQPPIGLTRLGLVAAAGRGGALPIGCWMPAAP
mmetsp:Transcript_39488/g.113955  ORF Transcript_39488/g.113955 Transcript_39488/m.113955 type:complete len:262 (-) Transcript_39488:17-802(-)